MIAKQDLDPEKEDESRFQIHSRVEIGFILRSVLQQGEMISVRFGGGSDSALTALLAVDPAKGFYVFDVPSDPALQRRLLAANRISFVSRQDKITVRWEVGSIQAVEHGGHPALRAPLPEMLLKLQRREFFRAETSVSRPVKCSIPLADGGDLQVNLFDISLGGVGLTGFPDDYPLEIGRDIQGCTITLPEIGVLAVTLQFRNSTEIPLRDGRVIRRAGCKFKSLPTGAENMIQRYIIRLERERRAKLA